MSPAALDSSLKKEPEIRITPFVCFADTSLGEGGKERANALRQCGRRARGGLFKRPKMVSDKTKTGGESGISCKKSARLQIIQGETKNLRFSGKN